MNETAPRARTAAAAAALLASLWSAASAAQVPTDPLTATRLPAASNPHWVWVNDVVFHHMADGKAFLLDGDSGRMLGMLSTGFGFNGVVLPKNAAAIYSPEIYFSRHTRGERTDVVTVYDPRELRPVAEIPIPPKRVSSMPMLANSRLTDDDRFLLVYNYTPAQSITVVDTKARKFVGEVDVAGCALVYPTGPRSFFSLCGDGTALLVQLDDDGKAAGKARSAQLFDPVRDPVTEKAVRSGSTWLFASFHGDIVPIEATPQGLKAGARWSLLDEADRKGSWKPGGMQHLALHEASGRLYSLMHVGGEDTHKDPGTEIWVYELAGKRRTQRIALKEPATSIAVTADAKPLLFAIFIAAQKVDVYDGQSGELLRTVPEIGFSPATLSTY